MHVHTHTCTCVNIHVQTVCVGNPPSLSYVILWFCVFSYPLTHRSAYTSSLKVLKLLLISQAYAFIISVSNEIKANVRAMNGERHLAACHVQDAINLIVTGTEQKLKQAAMGIAKNVSSKVVDCEKITVMRVFRIS